MIDPAEMLHRAAIMFYKQRQPLVAAICFAELARSRPTDPAVWCGLGSASCNCAGVFVREPFFVWGAKSFHRGIPLARGTAYEEVMREWLTTITNEINPSDYGPLRDDEISEMLDFFVVNESIFEAGIRGLAPDDQGFVIMALGDQQNPRFLPALLAAVRGAFGDSAARSALKRLGSFTGEPRVRAAIEEVAKTPRAAELQPYLAWAARAVDKDWAEALFAR